MSSRQTKFHSRDCYDIGPYKSSRDYIHSCYDREIYYYTHADKSDILTEPFEKITVPEFVESLKVEQQEVLRDAKMFEAIDAEPRVLVHEDFHIGNMLVRDGQLAAIVDWEFSGVYPLSELLGAISLVQISPPGRNETTEDEENRWCKQYFQYLEKVIRQRGWTEQNINALLGDGWPVLQKARSVMFPDDEFEEQELGG